MEAGHSSGIEVASRQTLEVPYVRIIRDIVHEKIPDHRQSFDITLDAINNQLMGDGLSVWNSREQPGVGFLSAHLAVTPDLIRRLATKSPPPPEFSDVSAAEDLQKMLAKRRKRKAPNIDHYVYLMEPYFGLGDDGSAISATDIAIASFISQMPKVAAALRSGTKPPTVDIYVVGSPTALGGQVTPDFVDGVRRNGFAQHGRIYAEFLYDHLPEGELDSTRIIIHGGSKGSITSDKTFKYLPVGIQERTQLLYDTPAGTHGKGVLERTLRTYNMGVGMAAEVAVRQFAGSVKNGAFAGQKEFYRQIARLKGIPEDTQEQGGLKRALFKQEIWTLAKGTPLDRNQRSFSRISTPDPVNINVRNVARVLSGGISDRLSGLADGTWGLVRKSRRGLTVSQEGRRLTFATGNTIHNFPWVRSINRGAWARKMNFVEHSKPASYAP